MIPFKQYFQEALDISTAKKYANLTDYKNYRNDVFNGRDRLILPNDINPAGRVDERLSRDMSAYLGLFGFGFLDRENNYMDGIAYPRLSPLYKDIRSFKFPVTKPLDDKIHYEAYPPDGKNKFKIGRILLKIINFLNKNPEDYREPYLKDYKKLVDRFVSDPGRTKNQLYKVVISRNPYDIAGMSTDRNWTSCMNLGGEGKIYKSGGASKPGEHFKSIPRFIKQKGLIAYLVPKNEIEESSGKCKLHKPISRINLTPFVNENGDIAYGVGKTYGHRFEEFTDIVKKFADEVLNVDIPDTEYQLAKGIYPDANIKTSFKTKGYNNDFPEK